ncbi:MAG: polysaccharide pyruvyl transferase family protein [Bryobacteraceae bacterium]
MRILLDQGVYDLRNAGNVALLQTAYDRIRRRWPEATLDVMTSAPHLLRLYCPGARPVSPDGDYNWDRRRGLVDSIVSHLPLSALRILLELREEIRRRWPSFGRVLTRAGLAGAASETRLTEQDVASRLAPAKPETAESNGLGNEYDKAVVTRVDLLVATGAQYMSDACGYNAHRVLNRMEAASRRGTITAMVGQGLGPLDDRRLRAHATQVMPLVDLILVRDARAGVKLLDSLGVNLERVAFTGDDAIEMAYRARPRELGKCLGIGLRISHYTEVSASHVELLRPVLLDAAARHGSRLFALPISRSLHELDDQALDQLVNGHGRRFFFGRCLQPPIEIVKQVGRCRVVVTGSFHPAVFALAQGIPVVGLALSAMYMEKFLSLLDQFGTGCQVVRLDGGDVKATLTDAIDNAWQSAEQLRPGLLQAAGNLVALGHSGYQRLFDRVESCVQGRRPSC